jgi:hypothetical protein
MTFVEQMANVGSEIERALIWRGKGNPDRAQRAFERALELMELTLADARGLARLKELARAREAMVDYFYGTNEFGTTETSWRQYFLPFAYAARREH